MSKGTTMPLGDICNIEYGTRVVKKRDGGNRYPVYGGGGAAFKMDVFNREDRLVIARFGMSAECTRFVEGRFFLNDSGLTVSPKNGLLVQRFLDYQMLSLNNEIYALGKGAAQKNLDVPAFRTLPLFVPNDAADQQRLVGVLDEAFAGLDLTRAHAKRNLQNASALFDSHLESVFARRGIGWVDRRLEEIGRTQTGSTPKASASTSYGEFIPFIKPSDLNVDGSLDCDNGGLSEQGLADARRVTSGSVLMVCIGATIGKCGFCDRDVTTNQQINAFTPVAGISHKFVYYQMLTENFQSSVIRNSAQATLPIISKKKWSALAIALPPTLEEQNLHVAKLDALFAETQRLAAVYQSKLAALAEFQRSLLHQAFSGAL